MSASGEQAPDPARVAWQRMRALIASPDVVTAEHEFMHRVGLPAGPVRTLRALLNTGAQPMRTLADRLGCDKSYVTSLVKPLLAKHLVTLEPDPTDRRVKVVTLTEAGTSIALEAKHVHDTPPPAIAGLTQEALRHLADLLPACES